MRTLIAALASLALLGCGGPDESLIASSVAQALESPPIGNMEEQLPTPEEEAKWALFWEHLAKVLQVAQDPVEERFYFPVDVNVPPPALPTPACPACR